MPPDAPSSDRPRRRTSPSASWLPLAALILLGALMRFPMLATQSVWFDEAATWELTRLPFGEMLRELPDRESNPPLFYVVEWAWTHVFGDGAFGLRSLPALAGTLLIPVAWGLGARLGGRTCAAITAALVAVSPLLVWFSQEARSYELVALLSAWSLLLFLRTLDDERPRLLGWWALLSALALCTHYFAAFVLLPQVLWLLWRHPRPRAARTAVGALVVVGLALLPLLLAQRGNPYDIAEDSLLVRLLQLPKQFLLGYYGPLALLTGLLGALLLASALWLLLRVATRPVRERALLVGAIGLVGVALPAAAAVVGVDYFNARNLIPALVPLIAAIAAGFATGGPPRAPWAGPLLATALCTLSAAIVVTVSADSRYQRPDWKGLAEALGSSDDPRAVVVAPANGEVALRFYRRGLHTMSRDVQEVREIDVIGVAGSDGPGSPRELPELFLDRTELAVPGFGEPERIATEDWVILRYRVPQPLPVVPDPLGAVRFSPRPPAVVVLPGGR